MAQLEHIEAIEKRLWGAADTLRANSNYASNEYFMPVMGLVFLRHAYSRYLAVKDVIKAKLPTRGGKTRALTKEDFSQQGDIFLRPEAQFDYLVSLPDNADRDKAIIKAMQSIEDDYDNLSGVLPKSEYQELDNEVLGSLLRTLNPEELKKVSGDVFGRIYEYFLTQFADQKAHDGGEFFTPVSLVSLIAHVLDPESGTVLDPACGSGGMFVQSARIVEEHGQSPTDRLTFRGLEKNATTIRLAKMNLAVHGLEGDILQAITYYKDPHELLNKADYVMANPPFNVDEIDAGKVKNDPRLPFGLHNNYERETYFIYLMEFDNYDKDEERDDMTIYCRGRYFKKNGDRYPLWCNEPAKCLQRGFIPTHLLKPEDMQAEIDTWLEQATSDLEPEGGKEELKAFYDYQKRVSDRIKDLRAIIANYNLPYLSLPAQTDKSVALNVFINMNTNSKPLSTYDIIVAEVEEVMGQSLHDLLDEMDQEDPNIARYEELPNMLLTTSALLQNQLPNQRGAWEMDKRKIVENWEVMKRGLSRMAEFLKGEGIYDHQRLPTNAVLAVIAALYRDIPESGDQRGQAELLLKRYLWYAFFTDRYENSAASRAFADFGALRKVVMGANKEDGSPFTSEHVPVFSEYVLVDVEELLTAEWPKRATIRGRAVLAVACRLGALDFSTGERLDVENVGQRHYHHVYPDALLKEAEIDGFTALNCALISDKTNISIGRWH